jgi:hypothetical protein
MQNSIQAYACMNIQSLYAHIFVQCNRSLRCYKRKLLVQRVFVSQNPHNWLKTLLGILMSGPSVDTYHKQINGDMRKNAAQRAKPPIPK